MICMLYMKSMPYNAKKIKQKMPAELTHIKCYRNKSTMLR